MNIKKLLIAIGSSAAVLIGMNTFSAYAGGNGSYLTQEGDCWSSVADKLWVDVNDLLEINGADWDTSLPLNEYIQIPYESGYTNENIREVSPDDFPTIELPTISEAEEDWETEEDWEFEESQPDPGPHRDFDSDFLENLTYEDFYNGDYALMGFESPYYGHIYNGFYFPAPYEGWYSIAEHSGYSLDTILEVNNATLDTPVIFGMGVYLPGEMIENFDSTDNSGVYDYSEAVEVVEEVLASQTLYNNPNADSWWNIVQGAKILDGTEIENGEIFSFYNCFPNQGGEADGMIESNYFIDENTIGRAFGSGLCFDSTTTSQAADKVEGLDIIERWAHVQDVGYATRGVDDAAVNLSVDPEYRQDLKILNNTGDRIRFNYEADSFTGALTCIISRVRSVAESFIN